MLSYKGGLKKLKKLTPQDIVTWLEHNPEFLAEHPEVLDFQEFEHDSGSATSLIEHQVSRLRKDNAQLKVSLEQLSENARLNEKRVRVLNTLSQMLIATRSLNEVVTQTARYLHENMSIDAIYIGIKHDSWQPSADSEQVNVLSPDDPQLKTTADVFRLGEPVCGTLDDKDFAVLFDSQWAQKLNSGAMVPLGVRKTSGVLVLASQAEGLFTPQMGTLFLELIGGLMTSAIRHYLGETVLV